jgi:hypothetical protein
MVMRRGRVGEARDVGRGLEENITDTTARKESR